MLCPNCNEEFTSKYCPSCGYNPMPDGPSSPQTAAAEPTYQQPQANQQQPQYQQQGYQQQPGYPPPQVVINNNIGGMPPYGAYPSPPKNRWSALILCFFFGWLGVHRFYVGKGGTGFLYAISGGLCGVGIIFDFITILTGSFTDKYGQRLTSGN